MTRRFAAVLARPDCGAGAPPGVDPDAFARALVEDTYEAVAGLAESEAAVVACPPAYAAAAVALVWPGTPVLTVDDGATDVVTSAALHSVATLGADDIALVAGDTPDLPGLLVGKLFSALTGAEVAVCPAAAGGLVALAVRLPIANWLAGAQAGLDTADAVERLTRVAPAPGRLVVVSGWHRLRSRSDIASLDPGLEGWDATRTLLSGS